jgi:hypothetical protein
MQVTGTNLWELTVRRVKAPAKEPSLVAFSLSQSTVLGADAVIRVAGVLVEVPPWEAGEDEARTGRMSTILLFD